MEPSFFCRDKMPALLPRARLVEARILAAATRLFIQQGYARTSLDQIAAAASAGKATVYARHGSKEALFEAVITAAVARAALADSPVGLASWILEKFHGWTDHDGDLLAVWPMETLIDNLMIYWLSNTIGSSVRYYYEGNRLRAPLTADAFIRVPTGIAVWPADIARPPREMAERLYDIRRYAVMSKGGHFPAWEAPHIYAEDLRGLVASVL